MARTVNAAQHAEKRTAIIVAAERLIYANGFEQMTIQDVLESLAISQGAFYHYFPSKAALLEAVVGHLLDEAVGVLRPIVDDPQATAREKLERYFAAHFAWRTMRKDALLAILRVWNRDDNALVRQKERAAMLERLTPLVAAILRQGVHEGTCVVPSPEHTAHVVVTLRMGLSEALAAHLLSLDPPEDGLAPLTPLAAMIAAYADAIERVLGAPPGSLRIADAEELKTWFD
jgi:AcrR family transcriptional regulator